MRIAGGSQPLLGDDLQEHSPEGVEILYSEPSSLFRWLILLFFALVVSALTWSLFARADIIVAAPGVLSSEDEVRRVYSPVDGELDALLIRAEEPLVEQGEPIARLRSRAAVRLRAEAEQARIALEEAQLRVKQQPRREALARRQIDVTRTELASKEEQLDRLFTASSEILRAGQMARLTEARGTLAAAAGRRDEARERFDSMRALAGRGVSQMDVERQRVVYQESRDAYRIASEELSALELQFVSEAAADRERLTALQLELEQLRIDLETQSLAIEQARATLDAEYASAVERAEAAKQIRFDESQDGNFIVVLAPLSGVVTNIVYSQPGDKVPANTPLLSIAPQGSRKVIEIDIAESDRGLLVEGSVVKMKFAAFPYQQYGFIEGTLEYISPTTRQSDPNRPPSYLGKVSLDRDYVESGTRRLPLRYGMTAVAEIVVRQRRVIDMALDPIRGI
ncbi:MAG: HlyD family efflux transporter periplasmic adaptor subunit [Pseudomonadota bacterium]